MQQDVRSVVFSEEMGGFAGSPGACLFTILWVPSCFSCWNIWEQVLVSRCSLLQMANKKLYLSVAPPTLTTNNISSSQTRPFQSFSVLLGSKKPTSCMALHSIPGPNSLRTWQHCGGGIGVLVAAKGLPFFRLIPIHLVRTFL